MPILLSSACSFIESADFFVSFINFHGARISQTGLLVIDKGQPNLRLSQEGLLIIDRASPNSYISQAGLLLVDKANPNSIFSQVGILLITGYIKPLTSTFVLGESADLYIRVTTPTIRKNIVSFNENGNFLITSYICKSFTQSLIENTDFYINEIIKNLNEHLVNFIENTDFKIILNSIVGNIYYENVFLAESADFTIVTVPLVPIFNSYVIIYLNSINLINFNLKNINSVNFNLNSKNCVNFYLNNFSDDEKIF